MRPEHRKSNLLRIRMTDEDRHLLEAVAGSEGLETSTWARNVLVRSAKRRATTIRTTWMSVSAEGTNDGIDGPAT